jgi:hypothetical protein
MGESEATNMSIVCEHVHVSRKILFKASGPRHTAQHSPAAGIVLA